MIIDFTKEELDFIGSSMMQYFIDEKDGKIEKMPEIALEISDKILSLLNGENWMDNLKGDLN